VAVGVLSSATRYAGTAAYTRSITAVDAAYRPTRMAVTVPAAEGALAGTYSYGFGFNPDGSPATTRLPAAGGLPAETVSTGYDGSGLPATLSTSDPSATYVTGTGYTAFAEPSVTNYRTGGGSIVQIGQYYQDGTRRLDRTWVTRETTPATVADIRYTRNPAGGLSSVAESPGTAAADTQCFGTDYLPRLTQAWTPASGDCAAAPTSGGLGGPAPYWLSWTYDTAGNRRTQTVHAAAGDTTSTLTYPAAGSHGHTPSRR
jgi:hypothetical protein